MKSIFCMLIVLMNWHMLVLPAAPGAEVERTTKKSNVITVEKLVKGFGDAISRKDQKAALSCCAQLSLFAFTDWKIFDDDQIEQWQKHLGLSIKQLEEGGVSNATTALNEEKKKQMSRLIKKIRNDECRIDWSGLLGASSEAPDEEQTPEKLKSHRISELRSFGAICSMN